jgi:hypothetical protein
MYGLSLVKYIGCGKKPPIYIDICSYISLVVFQYLKLFFIITPRVSALEVKYICMQTHVVESSLTQPLVRAMTIFLYKVE